MALDASRLRLLELLLSTVLNTSHNEKYSLRCGHTYMRANVCVHISKVSSAEYLPLLHVACSDIFYSFYVAF